MAKNLKLARTEAEWLVDLLEDCDPKKEGTWRHDLAAEIRDLFGMTTREEEMRRRAAIRTNTTTMKFNINSEVRVRLTDHGRALHRRAWNELNAKCGGKFPFAYEPPKEDADGWSRWQLWCLIGDFGPHLFMGCQMPFEAEICLVLPEPLRLQMSDDHTGAGRDA